MPTRAEFVAEARSWIDVPWRHQGRTRLGTDCVGLPEVCAFSLGMVAEVRRANYPRRPNKTFLLQLRRHPLLVSIPRASAKDADLLVLTALTEQFHLGIRATLSGLPSLIHAWEASGKVREEIIQDMPREMGVLTHAFAIKGIAD